MAIPLTVPVLSALVLWVYAARYLYGGFGAWKHRARFTFGPFDGFFLRGKTAGPRTTIALGLVFFLLPLSLLLRLWWLTRTP